MRKVEYNNYYFYVTIEGDVYNLKGKKLKKIKNKHRQNRENINTTKGKIKVSLLIAKAFPEICGKWFNGCEIHHINFNPENNCAYNLKVLTPEEHKIIHNGLIIQKSKEGKVLNTFISSLEAESKTNISSANIRMCLCGKSKTAGGFLWERLFS